MKICVVYSTLKIGDGDEAVSVPASSHEIDFNEVLEFLKDLRKDGIYLGRHLEDRLKQILGPLYPEDETV